DAGGAEADLLRLLAARLEAGVRGRLEHLEVLVQVRREQQELPLLDLELTGGLVDAALAQQDDLLAGLEGAADRGPFLQRHLQRRRPRHVRSSNLSDPTAPPPTSIWWRRQTCVTL